MYKKIIIAIIVLAGFMGLVWIGQPKGTENNSSAGIAASGLLSAEELNYDFGTVSMANGDVSHVFKVKNTGLNTVRIKKVYTSCMCTTAILRIGSKEFGPYGMPGHGSVYLRDAELSPGAEGEVEATFDPNAHGPAGVGKIDRVIILEDDAGGKVEFEFSAVVTP